ncbi:hypothetical protein M430DRAFT_130939 [Amorphotheca resinae ATCC 22711]|uniref:Yippee domain-containing protein n=1 Tax=Amorphotheca resinae ATCC 22711 TaxID=857342 RepID=A0A2T3BDH6_AMORE|nr:hypothetical protein M430DRAFT_130939 [Amorphotheca resinae ATCC 22711]PSS27422.1 hypothetical protein M430DRAFT_130939 [Amorphotheca resinae ATCC 22711]
MPSDQIFPTYLVPSFPFSSPFRWRQQSTSSTSSETSENSSRSSPNPDPQIHKEERLCRSQPDTLKCLTCATDIAFASQIVSKGFTGRHGRAYLVSPPARLPSSHKKKNHKSTDLVNIRIGRAVNRELLTGEHVVADVSCAICQTVLGWKYVDAKEQGQRYKIGKYILETKRVIPSVSWEDGTEEPELEQAEGADRDSDEAIVFDEDDEDECEDLFNGIWDPKVVAKRRSRKVKRKVDPSS